MPVVRFRPEMADTLDLSTLKLGMPGLTPSIGAYFAEAAATCLEEQAHSPGVWMKLDGDCDHRLKVLWLIDGNRNQRMRAWGDPDVATEQGAYGIAALIVATLSEYTILERSRKGTGFDYWLGKKDSVMPLFQDKARLEVSGMRRGDDRAVEARVRAKERQVRPSDARLPILVAVIEFGSPRTRVRSR